MNDLIKKLIDIDKKAQTLDADATKVKENLENDIKKEASAIEDKYMAEAENIIDKEVSLIKTKYENEWEVEEKQRNAILEKLNNNFNNNCDKWVDKIVSDILN